MKKTIVAVVLMSVLAVGVFGQNFEYPNGAFLLMDIGLTQDDIKKAYSGSDIVDGEEPGTLVVKTDSGIEYGKWKFNDQGKCAYSYRLTQIDSDYHEFIAYWVNMGYSITDDKTENGDPLMVLLSPSQKALLTFLYNNRTQILQISVEVPSAAQADISPFEGIWEYRHEWRRRTVRFNGLKCRGKNFAYTSTMLIFPHLAKVLPNIMSFQFAGTETDSIFYDIIDQDNSNDILFWQFDNGKLILSGTSSLTLTRVKY